MTCRKIVLGGAGVAAGVQRDCDMAALADFNKLTGLGSEHPSLKLFSAGIRPEICRCPSQLWLFWETLYWSLPFVFIADLCFIQAISN